MHVTVSIAYSIAAYHRLGWSELNTRNKLDVIKSRLTKPEACPICGRVPVQLFNKSCLYLDDDSDYEWSCRQCYEKKKRPVRHCIHAGDKLKPWSELKRRGKVSRILRDLPKPGACLYCDAVQVELTSRSGTWLEDLTDYAWVCRHHALMIAALRPVPVPAMPITIEPLDPDLFQYLYNNTMPGTFEGHSILNKRCAAGRFLAFEPLSLKKYLLS